MSTKTRKKSLGIFMPPRQPNQFHLDKDLNTIGILPPGILVPLLTQLRSQSHLELVEGLNFRQAMIRNGKVYIGDFCLNNLDRFVWYCDVTRGPYGYDLEVLNTLSREVEVVRNPVRYQIAQDKYQAHLSLRDAGVCVPDTCLFDHKVPEQMASILEEWDRAILKPRRGGWGKGVTLINSVEQLRDIVGYVRSTAEASPDYGFFLERYYENDPSRWASLTMINGELALAYRKKEHKFQDLGDGKFKVHDIEEQGGGVVLADLTPEHYDQAYKAYEALGLGLIGFDMIWTRKGPMIVDENTAPGNYPDLYALEGKNPAIYFAKWVLKGI